MNKRRRYKAKARRAEAKFWERMRRPARFTFWRTQSLGDEDRRRAFDHLRDVMRSIYARCERGPVVN